MHPQMFPENTSLVMAHPDDEVLWASSVLAQMERIVLCFEGVASRPAWGEGRRRSLASYPLAHTINLGIEESETFNSAAWPAPIETDYGLEVRRGPRSMAGFSVTRYRENRKRLEEALRPILVGVPSVLTHNPWGEYGHEEHVQVFRAVASLREELGFALWVPGYVSQKSYPMMLRHLPELDVQPASHVTDIALAESLQALYNRNGCWTWFDDYVWPPRESFYRWTGISPSIPQQRDGRVFNVNMLSLQEPVRRALPIGRRLFRWARRRFG